MDVRCPVKASDTIGKRVPITTMAANVKSKNCVITKADSLLTPQTLSVSAGKTACARHA